MTKAEMIMIAAILLGPVLAVQIQKFIESLRESRHRKLTLFRTLMATRATPISPAHVEALNMIDLEFYGRKAVTEAWKVYLDQLLNGPRNFEEQGYRAKLDAWTTRNNELLTDLLFAMSRNLGYKFDKVHLKRDVYFPKGHADIEDERTFIRQALVDVLQGRRTFPISVVNNTQGEQTSGADK